MVTASVLQSVASSSDVFFGQEAEALIPAKEAALLLQVAGNQNIILLFISSKSQLEADAMQT